MRARRIMAWCGLVAVATGGLTWFLCLPSTQTLTLPDGSTLTLIKASFGTNHVCRYGTGWREIIYPVLPPRLRANYSAKVAKLTTTRSNDIVLWVRHNPIPAWGNLSQRKLSTFAVGAETGFSVVDASGLESALLPLQSSFGMRTGAWAGAYLVTNCPRRMDPIRIRAYQSDISRRLKRVGEFELPNQYGKAFPEWSPAPLPASRRLSADAEFTLNALENGLTDSEARLYILVGDEARAFARATVQIKESDHSTIHWRVGDVRLVSATGDQWPMQSHTSWGNGWITFDFLGALWAEEPAFKLYAHVYQAADTNRALDLEFLVKPQLKTNLAGRR